MSTLSVRVFLLAGIFAPLTKLTLAIKKYREQAGRTLIKTPLLITIPSF